MDLKAEDLVKGESLVKAEMDQVAQSITSEEAFVLEPEIVSVAGLLFDMDGTIIDSTAAVVRHWTEIGQEIGVDPRVILATSHGRRSIDVFRILDPSKATWEYVKQVETAMPAKFGADAVEIPGARALLDDLSAAGVPWTIVTSGSRGLVTGWINALDLPRPKHPDSMVTAEDVQDGKPDPACYVLGRERLAAATGGPVLVLEDAPAGIQAGHEAGCKVVALVTSHTTQQLDETKADWIVRDMRSVRLLGAADGLFRIEISHALRR